MMTLRINMTSKKDDLEMKTSSKWISPQSEDNLKNVKKISFIELLTHLETGQRIQIDQLF